MTPRQHKDHQPIQYASIDGVSYGPRFKSAATSRLEMLIKDILCMYSQGQEMLVQYSPQSEMIITAKNNVYNLTAILKAQPDFEQFSFDKTDIDRFDKMLRAPKVVWEHIENHCKLSHKDFTKIKNGFPDLSLAEASAICSYTRDLYAPVYFILNNYAQKHFPKRNNANEGEIDLEGVLDNFARVYDPNYIRDSKNPDDPGYDYNFEDPGLLASLMREVLVNACMASFALSKNVQPALKVCVVESEKELRANIDNISGITLVLIKRENAPGEYNVCLVAYGELTIAFVHAVDIIELLKQRIGVKNDGLSITEQEYQSIVNELQHNKGLNFLSDLPEIVFTKLTNILTSHTEIKNALYEELVRVEEHPVDFTEKVLPIFSFSNLNAVNGMFATAFFSTSTRILRGFESENENVIFHLINPVFFGKNIRYISDIQFEDERLFIPGQQFIITGMFKKENIYTGKTDVHLTGYPARSIDGLQTPPEHKKFISLQSHASFFSVGKSDDKEFSSKTKLNY